MFFFKLIIFRQRKDCTDISIAKSFMYTLCNSLKRATPLAAEKETHIFETSASACQHGCVHVWSFCSSEASGSAALAAACVHATWPCFLQQRRQIMSWPSSLSRSSTARGAMTGTQGALIFYKVLFWKSVANVCHGACGPRWAPNVTTAHAAVIHSGSLVVD